MKTFRRFGGSRALRCFAVGCSALLIYGANAAASDETGLSRSEREKRLKALEKANSNPATSKEKLLAALLATYEESIRAAKAELIKSIPKKQAERIDKAALDFDPEDSFMGFTTLAKEDGMISLSVGGIRTMSMILNAALIAQHGYRSTNWLINYALYAREGYLGDRGIASPYEAAGLHGDSFDKAFLDKSSNALEDALLFTLAHESAHLLLKHGDERRDDENESEFSQRLQKQETAADEYAMGVYSSRKTPPLCIATVLTFLVMVYEPRTGELASAVHPPDRARLVNLLQSSLALIKRFPKGPPEELNAFSASAQESIKILSNDARYADFLAERDSKLPAPTLKELQNIP